MLVDDMTGEQADQSVTFGLDGVAYKIDLTDANASGLRDALAVYIGSAERLGKYELAGKPKAQVPPPGQRRTREELDAIRVWANDNGYAVSDRGRIKEEIIEAYDKAH